MTATAPDGIIFQLRQGYELAIPVPGDGLVAKIAALEHRPGVPETPVRVVERIARQAALVFDTAIWKTRPARRNGEPFTVWQLTWREAVDMLTIAVSEAIGCDGELVFHQQAFLRELFEANHALHAKPLCELLAIARSIEARE